ncbi:hypothetical protein MUB04_15900 [Acinetobacter indicus]|uniref:hypothetical protein n=1 Tax=Acinetobacter TaxID=469 RepID=UPI0015D37BC3|nr:MULTISPECIES: hypothetical protein [Acinetobacter]MCP0918022.1 hypothetical protein [Acinetobacter indicus]
MNQVKQDYKIGDLVVMVDTIADSQVHAISETPCIHGRTVVLNGYRYQTGVQFIRPATAEERQQRQRIIQ